MPEGIIDRIPKVLKLGYGNDSSDKGSFADFPLPSIAETRILPLGLTFSTSEDSQKGDRYKSGWMVILGDMTLYRQNRCRPPR